MLLDVGSVSTCKFFVERKSSDWVVFVIIDDIEVLQLFRDLLEIFVSDLDDGAVERTEYASSYLRRFLDLVARYFKDSLDEESAAGNEFG